MMLGDLDSPFSCSPLKQVFPTCKQALRDMNNETHKDDR